MSDQSQTKTWAQQHAELMAKVAATPVVKVERTTDWHNGMNRAKLPRSTTKRSK